MYMAKIRVVIVSVLVSLLMACVMKPRVTADYDTDFDFNTLKTYAWIARDNDREIVSLNNKRQNSAIEKVLGWKGFTKASAGITPNFLIKTHHCKPFETYSQVLPIRFYP